MEQIEKTKEYHVFKTLDGNRPLIKSHIKKLKESVSNNNFLNLHPIVVNENFEIIDGQHRLEVAKQLGVEIFYILSSKVTDDHLITSNVNQKGWEVENYIDFYACKHKIEPYIQFKQMMIQSGLKPKAILNLTLGIVSTNLLQFLKTGKFKFPASENPQKILDFYCDFIAYARDKRIRPLSMFTNHHFTKSFRWLYRTTGFETNIFFKKLDLKWFDLKPQRTAEEWYQLILSIYNFKNHNRIENALD